VSDGVPCTTAHAMGPGPGPGLGPGPRPGPGPGPYEPRPGTIPTLPVPDPARWRRLHLIGIGGAGMSGIARLLLARGIEVTGSDLKASPGLAGLEAAGATVFVGHRAEQVGSPDAVVVSSAIPPANPELREARRAGVPVLMRAQVLAALMRGRRGVAVAGTHGKTTTTSMISVVLSRTGLDPTYVIGGDLNESGSGAGHGDGSVFVAEADESDGSFLLLGAELGVITNAEEDHLDFYRDRTEVEAAFGAFAARVGTVVACWDDPGVRRAVAGAPARLVRYGSRDDVEVSVRDPLTGPEGSRATVTLWGRPVQVRLAVPGRHNLLNAAAALAVAVLLGVEPDAAASALGTFSGVRRRFERRGTAGGATFVDDYAHHPSEVVATLAAARAVRAGSHPAAGQGGGRADADGRLVAVFQPHRYSRTRAMWRDLGESLRGADLVLVTDVYAAGEDPIPGVTGKLLVDALAEAAPGKRVVYLPRRAEVASHLAALVRPGDLVLTLGAGDITMVGEETLERLADGAVES
jgi:UDP-N-acetylmuramate--alanine ligase